MTHVVITTPYGAKDSYRILKALRMFDGLGVKSATIVYDRKGQSGVQAQNAKKAWNGMIEVSLLEVDETETALRWLPAIVDAFNRARVDRTLLFPGDLDSAGADFVLRCKTLLDSSTVDGLTVGYYTSSDLFKESFDERATIPILEVLYPELVPCIREIGCTKLRSEITVIGVEFFREFLSTYRWRWSCDPIVQLILFGVGRDKDKPNGERRVKAVDLGDFSDVKDTRSPIGQLYQLHRLALALCEDKLLWRQ